MKKPVLVVLFALVPALFGTAGCKESSGTATASAATASVATASAATASAAGDQHAAEGAKPGTWEDWCGEHAVPESQCTQCHKELIAAFKATGDWCDEHGLPKSHCKRCDPSLVIARPPKDAR